MKKYITYIIFSILIIVVLLVGFIYGNNTTKEYEKKEVILENPIKEEKEIIKYKVDIKGSVKKPGVYELDENSRVIDVINKAGGLLKDSNTDYINLSKKIIDEMVIIIYTNKELEKIKEEKKEIIKYEVIEVEKECPNKTNNACIKNAKETTNNQIEENDKEKKININTSTKEELMTLPSIGESKANIIIEYRNTNKFNTIEDIKNVKGIGEALFEKIKDNITI